MVQAFHLAMTDFLNQNFKWTHVIIVLYPASVGTMLRYYVFYNLQLFGFFPLIILKVIKCFSKPI